MHKNLNYKITKIEHKTSENNRLMTLLFKMVALWLLSEKEDISFSGTEEEIKALSQIMMASKEFYQYLRKTEDIDPDVLSSLLKRKNNFALNFSKVFNTNWPF